MNVLVHQMGNLKMAPMVILLLGMWVFGGIKQFYINRITSRDGNVSFHGVFHGSRDKKRFFSSGIPIRDKKKLQTVIFSMKHIILTAGVGSAECNSMEIQFSKGLKIFRKSMFFVRLQISRGKTLFNCCIVIIVGREPGTPQVLQPKTLEDW